MPGKTWWFSVGPLDGARAEQLTVELDTLLEPGIDVLALDWDSWFCRALPESVVLDMVAIVKAGLDQLDPASDRHVVATAFLDDMQTWLDRDRGL